MVKEHRRRGRPTGTKKNGVKSAHHKLKILRTKAWAHTCTEFFSVAFGHYVSLENLALLANRYTTNPKKDDETYDACFWSRVKNGKRGATESTVLDLWAIFHDVYFRGPLTINPINNKGGCIPLWCAFSNKKTDILEDWNKVSDGMWAAWAPPDDHSPWIPDQEYIPPKKFKNLGDVNFFAQRLAERKKPVPAMLAFAAWLTIARINDDAIVPVFDNSHPWNCDDSDPQKYEYFKNSIIDSLSKLKIDFSEISDIARSSGFIIPGPEGMGQEDFDIYKKLTSIGSTESFIIDEPFRPTGFFSCKKKMDSPPLAEDLESGE